MAMAVAMQRAGRVGALMRGPEWYSSIAARSMSSVVRVEDDGPSASHRRALGALSAILGAGALYNSCQHTVLTINLEPAAAEESAPKTALNPKEFLKFKVAEVYDVNHNTKVYRSSTKRGRGGRRSRSRSHKRHLSSTADDLDDLLVVDEQDHGAAPWLRMGQGSSHLWLPPGLESLGMGNLGMAASGWGQPGSHWGSSMPGIELILV